jgi:hypothetical protein
MGKFRVHSALVPSKITIANISKSEFFLGNIGVFTMDSRRNQLRKILRTNFDIFLEKFLVNSSNILFHCRRIVRGINLGKIPRIFIIPKSFSSEVPCPDRVICVEGCCANEPQFASIAP